MDILVIGLIVVMVGIPLAQFFLMRKAFKEPRKHRGRDGAHASAIVLDGAGGGKSVHKSGKGDDSPDSGASDGGDGGGGGGE